MKLDLKIYIDVENEYRSVAGQIWDILCEADEEFVPPLSVRDAENVVFEGRTELKPTGKPYAFYGEVLRENIIAAFDGDKLAGFLSYETDYSNDDLKERRYEKCWYVNALIVKKEYRGNGIATKLYESLEVHAIGKADSIITRTWSLNHSHISLVRARGYRLIIRLEDHRAKGVDTVYYRREIRHSLG
jgi:ribosomal protein S18 acetylase RimI-like enzyme